MGRRIAVVVLVPYAAWLILAYEYHFIDGVNLAFHEAGHLFFGLFGQWPHFLGGSLGQFVFPVACGIHFLHRGQRFEAALCGLWGAENLMYVAVYLGDAQAQLLPLVGGGIHDWHWMLTRVGLLARCQGIAAVLHGLASVLLLGFLGLAAREAFGRPTPARARESAFAGSVLSPAGQGPGLDVVPTDSPAHLAMADIPPGGAATYGAPTRRAD